MNANREPVARQSRPSTLARAKFGPGMLLQHEDLEQLNAYTRDLSRLLFRSFFGCGVVCGLVVETESRCGKVNVTVGSGLALDCQGDPIHLPRSITFALDEHCDPNLPSPLWVVLCGIEKCCSPRTATCASDDEETTSVCTRERDWFEIRVMRTRPKCACSCAEPNADDPPQGVPEDECRCANPEHPCYKDHYEGKCGCDCEDCAKCDCDCVVLARLDRIGDNPDDPEWKPDHRVRRFIRPMLMRDHQVFLEDEARKDAFQGNEQKRIEEEKRKRDAEELKKRRDDEAKKLREEAEKKRREEGRKTKETPKS
jgi:hypothetical protein